MSLTQGLFITGTNTNVGKTWVSIRLILALCQLQRHVTPRKPVESGWPNNQAAIPHTDAWQLQQAAHTQESLQTICPYHYPAAISPPRAAQLQGEHLSLRQLAQACVHTPQNERDFLLVEGAGGFYSPIAEDGLNADLNQQLNLPLLLIAEDRLGCIHEVLLCVEAMLGREQDLLGIVLNQKRQLNSDTEDAHSARLMNNAEDLRQLQSVPVFSCSTDSDSSFFIMLAEHCLQYYPK